MRQFRHTDLEQIEKLDKMLWLQLKWNKTFHSEDAFVAFEGERIVGAAALYYDRTFYYLWRTEGHIPKYHMGISYVVEETREDKLIIKCALFERMKVHLRKWRERYPDKKMSMRICCNHTEIEETEFMLSQGFTIEQVIMVMRFDLTREIPKYEIPKEVEIGVHNFDGDGMERYMKANELGFDNLQDAEDELRFELMADNAKVFTATVNGEVVSSTTTWSFGEGHSATENVFTIPAYRRKNIGIETVCTALRSLKEDGEKEATLTVFGSNLAAIQMYLKIGYHLQYYLMEMHYTL